MCIKILSVTSGWDERVGVGKLRRLLANLLVLKQIYVLTSFFEETLIFPHGFPEILPYVCV